MADDLRLLVHLTVADLRAIIAEELDAAIARAPESEVMTTKQVAAKWKMHEKTIARLVRTEGLPAHRLGASAAHGDYRFRAHEVEAWFAQRKAG